MVQQQITHNYSQTTTIENIRKYHLPCNNSAFCQAPNILNPFIFYMSIYNSSAVTVYK